MALTVLALALVVLVGATGSTPAVRKENSVQQLYDSFTDQEKEYFIRYQLAIVVVNQHTARLPGDITIDPPLSIPQVIREKIEDVSRKLPTDFPGRLYKLVTTMYSLTYKQVRTLVRSGQVCNAQGICLYPKDVGSSCCPF